MSRWYVGRGPRKLIHAQTGQDIGEAEQIEEACGSRSIKNLQKKVNKQHYLATDLLDKQGSVHFLQIFKQGSVHFLMIFTQGSVEYRLNAII